MASIALWTSLAENPISMRGVAIGEICSPFSFGTVLFVLLLLGHIYIVFDRWSILRRDLKILLGVSSVALDVSPETFKINYR